MDTDYWKSSPFGEESIFHPSWEEKRKQERQILLSTGKITNVLVTKGNGMYVNSYPRQDNLSPERYISESSRQRAHSVYIKVSVIVEGRAEAIYIAINNQFKRAMGCEQTFEIKVPATSSKETINVKVHLTDFMGKDVYDKKEYDVTIDSGGNVFEKKEVEEEINNELTLDIVRKIAPACSQNNISNHINSLNQAIRTYSIDSYLRKVHFLSQLIFESGYLKYTKEQGVTENDYNGFYGRGLLQITFKGNYLEYQQNCGEDVTSTLSNRQKLEKPPHAALSAAWYWNKCNLNYYADKNDFIMITAKINGGFNGFEQRLSLVQQAIKALSQFYDTTISTDYVFKNSAAYTNAIYCFAWGLWHDPDLNKSGCKKNIQEALDGYKQMLALIPDNYNVCNRYNVHKMETFNDLKDEKGDVYIEHVARKRILELQQ